MQPPTHPKVPAWTQIPSQMYLQHPLTHAGQGEGVVLEVVVEVVDEVEVVDDVVVVDVVEVVVEVVVVVGAAVVLVLVVVEVVLLVVVLVVPGPQQLTPVSHNDVPVGPL